MKITEIDFVSFVSIKLHRKWMKDPVFKQGYETLISNTAVQIKKARAMRKISQSELAKRMGTGQAVISRLENMNARPSLSILQRLADAMGLKVELKFTPK